MLFTKVEVELSMQKSYFAFLFFQVFLVVSISSFFTTILHSLVHDLSSVPARFWPRTFLKPAITPVSFLLVRALSVGTAAVLQIDRLSCSLAFGPFLGRTPRQKWRRRSTLSEDRWSDIFPVYTDLACISACEDSY